MFDLRDEIPTKGRGAVANPVGRHELLGRFNIDDGWDYDDPDLPPLRTLVTPEACRSALTYNTSPDLPFDRSINPYRGCEHGCIYCYARPSHANMGLSPGLDFESRLFAKPDIAYVLEKQLRKPGYRPAPIMLGSNTDPYQPIEKQHRLTRKILEVLAACDHPVTVVTKSAMVLRDLDLLAPMAEKGLVSVAVSVTTLDRDLARSMEPRAATPDKRLHTIAELSKAGVPAMVFAAPMIPFLNDAELESILAAGKKAGAVAASYILIRLPMELKDLFEDWLKQHAPGKAAHVLSLIRQVRGGELNDATFGRRMKGSGEIADLLAKRFRLACRKHGLSPAKDSGLKLDTGLFRMPVRAGDQLALF